MVRMLRLVLVCFLALSTFERLSAADKYIVKTFWKNGKEVAIIKFPVKPPAIRPASVNVPAPNRNRGTDTITDVPTFGWTYGCAATSAGMIMGFYDRNGYSNMYTGTVNGGVCPPTNNSSQWGAPITYDSVTCNQCSFVASSQGIDGRTTKGHVQDYWVDYESTEDPYHGNWTEHSPKDCLGDFMGTNQYYNSQNTDGSTVSFYYTDGTPYIPDGTEKETQGAIDGCWGMKEYVESCGYTATNYYTQLIKGYNGNSQGFTFEDFQAEIDAGRPVLVMVTGHMMVGVGYDTSTNTMYIKDTWHDEEGATQSMTWGGSYEGMTHIAMVLFEMEPVSETPTIATDVTENTITAVAATGSDADSQKFNIWNSGGGSLSFTAAAANDQTWLSISPTSGTSTGSSDKVEVTATFSTSSLEAGTYSTTITITDENASNSPQTITVNLTVSDSPPPFISTSVVGNSISNSCAVGEDAPTKSFYVWNGGGETLSFSIASSESWVTPSPSSGSSTGNDNQVAVSLSFASSSLAEGTYSSTLTITDENASNNPVAITVTLTVANSTIPEIETNTSVLTASCAVGSNAASQTFNVWNAGTGTLSFTVSTDQTWLTCSPTTGTSSNSDDKVAISAVFNSSALSSGDYTGKITITDSNASNSPATITVSLSVTVQPTIVLASSSENWKKSGETTDYMFSISTDFGKNPSQETFTVANQNSETVLNYFLNENSPWLLLSPTQGDSTGSSDQDTITLTFNTTSLAIGDYSTTIKVGDNSASNSPQTILVKLTVGPEAVPKDDLKAGLIGDDSGAITKNAQNRVSYWADASGEGNNVYQRRTNKQPVFVSTLRGSSVMYFTGKDSLSFDNNSAISSGGPYTAKSIVLAFRTSEDINSGQILFEQGDSKSGMNIYIHDSQISASAWNTPSGSSETTQWGPLTISGNILQESYHYLYFIYDQANTRSIYAYLDGVALGGVSGAGVLASSSQGACLGNKDGSTYLPRGVKAGGFKGYLCEFYYYNEKALSNDDITNLTTYLNNRYSDTFSGVNSFALWLDASKSVNLSKNDKVESWTDSSPNHAMFSQTRYNSQPILYEKATSNNLPGILFDGTNGGLLAKNDPIINGDDFTNKNIFVVFKTGKDVTSPQIIWNQGNKKTGLNIAIENGSLSMSAWNDKGKASWGPVSVTRAIQTDTLYYAQLTYSYPQNLFKGYLQILEPNETKNILGPVGVSVGTLPKHNPASIGFCKSTTVNCGDGKKGKNLSGIICEIISYNTSLTSSQVSEIDSYVNNKYNP